MTSYNEAHGDGKNYESQWRNYAIKFFFPFCDYFKL